MQDTGGAESLAIRANTSNAMEFLTGGGEKMRIDSSGKLRVGRNTSSDLGGISQVSSLGSAGVDNSTGDTQGLVLRMDQGPSNVTLTGVSDYHMKLWNNAYDGTGISNPQGTRAKLVFHTATWNGYNAYSGIVGDTQGASGGMGELVFLTGSMSERMRIDSSGRVTMPYQPAFRAINAPSIGNSGTLIWANAPVNTGSCYNTSNGRFTAPVAGNYIFTMSMLFSSNSNYARIEFTVNGTPETTYADTLESSNGSYLTLNASSVIQLSAGDYVSVKNTGQINTYGAGYGSFCGHLIG